MNELVEGREKQEEEEEGWVFSQPCASFIFLIKAGAVGAVKKEPQGHGDPGLSLSLASGGG